MTVTPADIEACREAVRAYRAYLKSRGRDTADADWWIARIQRGLGVPDKPRLDRMRESGED